jgi:hypothetical protein
VGGALACVQPQCNPIPLPQSGGLNLSTAFTHIPQARTPRHDLNDRVTQQWGPDRDASCDRSHRPSCSYHSSVSLAADGSVANDGRRDEGPILTPLTARLCSFLLSGGACSSSQQQQLFMVTDGMSVQVTGWTVGIQDACPRLGCD